MPITRFSNLFKSTNNYSGNSRRLARKSSGSKDTFTRSSRQSNRTLELAKGVSNKSKSSTGLLLAAAGAAIGTGLAAFALPIAGALLVGGGIGAIAGGAIGQGALSGENGFSSYTDYTNPDSPLNPNNPQNPMFWAE